MAWTSRSQPGARRQGLHALPLRWRIEATFGTMTNRYRRSPEIWNTVRPRLKMPSPTAIGFCAPITGSKTTPCSQTGLSVLSYSLTHSAGVRTGWGEALGMLEVRDRWSRSPGHCFVGKIREFDLSGCASFGSKAEASHEAVHSFLKIFSEVNDAAIQVTQD